MIDDLITLLKDLRRADEQSRSTGGGTTDAADARREVDRIRRAIWSTDGLGQPGMPEDEGDRRTG